MKRMSVKQYVLPVKVKKDGDGYLAVCENWADCFAQGDTVEEALSEINLVAGSLVDLYGDEGMKVPLKLDKPKVSMNRSANFDLPLVVSSVL